MPTMYVHQYRKLMEGQVCVVRLNTAGVNEDSLSGKGLLLWSGLMQVPSLLTAVKYGGLGSVTPGIRHLQLMEWIRSTVSFHPAWGKSLYHGPKVLSLSVRSHITVARNTGSLPCPWGRRVIREVPHAAPAPSASSAALIGRNPNQWELQGQCQWVRSTLTF